MKTIRYARVTLFQSPFNRHRWGVLGLGDSVENVSEETVPAVVSRKQAEYLARVALDVSAAGKPLDDTSFEFVVERRYQPMWDPDKKE